MKLAKPLVFNLLALVLLILGARRWLSQETALDFAVGWLTGVTVLALAGALHRWPRNPLGKNRRSTRPTSTPVTPSQEQK